ncbi:MAG: hypothetical protein RIM72_23460 [Alphaproteobacteria bacterium]
MTTRKPGPSSGSKNAKAERAERLAAQLRANLKKRKAQTRDRINKDVSPSRGDGESGQS